MAGVADRVRHSLDRPTDENDRVEVAGVDVLAIEQVPRLAKEGELSLVGASGGRRLGRRRPLEPDAAEEQRRGQRDDAEPAEAVPADRGLR